MAPRSLRRSISRSWPILAANRWLSVILPYRPLSGGRDRLDAEYAAGKWAYLGGLSELARFGVVAVYCQYLKPGGSILEVGCGEGVLQQRLNSDKYSRYVGVDISAEAVDRAARHATPRASFVRADGATYEPGERFDVVVFNEVLEYFEDPSAVARRYERFLADDGVFIVSMFVGVDTARAKRIWKRLQSLYRVIDETKVANKARMTWTIKVLAPLPPRGTE